MSELLTEPRTDSAIAIGRSEGTAKTFIRVAEIWVPTRDRMQLEFLDGLYGPLAEFRHIPLIEP